jgi:2-hydroxychromene-2-carboxylate isomerase
MMTGEERREKARLRSERWRRAHGIPPRKPAQKPWLAEGISRSTWYRRRAKAREQAAVALAATMREAVFDRLDWQLARLRGDLDRCARFAD